MLELLPVIGSICLTGDISKLREEMDYPLRTAAAAFEYHSRAKLNQALAKRGAAATL